MAKRRKSMEKLTTGLFVEDGKIIKGFGKYFILLGLCLFISTITLIWRTLTWKN